MQAYVGRFTTVAAGNSVVVSGLVDAAGVAFEPKVVIFIGAGYESLTGNFWQSFGFDDGTTHYGHTGSEPDYVGGLANPIGGTSTQYSILAASTPGFITSVIRTGYMSSKAVGTFTVHFDRNDVVGDDIIYLALGGSDLQYAMGRFAPNSGHANQAVTGVGFKPCGLFFLPNVSVGTTPNSGDYSQSFGFASASASMALCLGSGQFIGNKSVCSKVLRTDRCMITLDTGTDLSPLAFPFFSNRQLVSLDTDGFTIVQGAETNNPDAAWAYLALKYVSVSQVNITAPSVTGVQTYPTLIHQRAAMFFSVNIPSATDPSTNERLSVGLTDGVRQEMIWLGQQNQSASLSAVNESIDSAVVISATPNTTPANTTVQAQANFVDFQNVVGSQSFRLNWTVIDSSGFQTVAIVLGDGTAECASTDTTTSQTPIDDTAGNPNQWKLHRYDMKPSPGQSA